MWTLNASWLREFSRSNIAVQALVTIELQPSDSFVVTNYALAVGSGLVVTFDANPVTEGTDWTAATSNLTTANNIITALRASAAPTTAYRFKVRTRADGAVEVQCFNAAGGTPTLTLSSQAFGVVDGPAFPTFLSLAKADQPLAAVNVPNSIREIRGLEMTLDPISREFSCSSVEIEIADDGLIREVASRYMLIGRYVDIALGSENLSTANFEPWPRLYITRVRALPNRGGIVITASDTTHRLRDRQITGRWVNEHPLDVATSLFAQTGTAYDATSWDPATAANDSIGHYVVSRYDDQLFGVSTGVDEPTRALDVLQSLMPVLGGTARLNQSGDLEFTPYDAAAASVRTFTHTEEPGEFQVSIESTDDGQADIANSVAVSFCRSSKAASGTQTFRLQDNTAQLEIGRRMEITIEVDWCNAIAFNFQSAPDIAVSQVVSWSGGVGAIIGVFYASRQGFCGSRWHNDPYALQLETWAQLNGTNKPLILALTVYSLFSGFPTEIEYVAFDTSTIVPPDGLATVRDSANIRADIPLQVIYEVASGYNDFGFTAGRGGFNSNSVASSAVAAVDVTIPFAIAQRVLSRYRYGAPVVVVRAPLRHFDLEVGDIVRLTDPDLMVGFLLDDATVFYEITRKTVRAFEDEPSIEFELTFFRAEDNPVYEAAFVPTYDDSIVVFVPTESDGIVTNDGDPVWTDNDGDGTIGVGDEPLIVG